MVFGGGGTNLGTAVLELRGDTRSLKRDLDRAERTTRNRVARIGKIVAGFGIAGIGTGIFGGINVLRAASSLEESTNAVNVVVKDAAG